MITIKARCRFPDCHDGLHFAIIDRLDEWRRGFDVFREVISLFESREIMLPLSAASENCSGDALSGRRGACATPAGRSPRAGTSPSGRQEGGARRASMRAATSTLRRRARAPYDMTSSSVHAGFLYDFDATL